MMMWCSCESMMPGERYDVTKTPGAPLRRFLVRYYEEDPSKANVVIAVLWQGKFLISGESNQLIDATVTHWMLIENP